MWQSFVISEFNSYPLGCVITNSASCNCIIFTKEFATACGNTLGCGAHESTTLGFGFVLCSSKVIASARACNGCPIELSILTTGTSAYFTKPFKTSSASSFSLSVSEANARIAKISQY